MSSPSRAARAGNAVAFWLVLPLALLMSCVSTMPGGCTKDKAYITAAKSDLRNMLTLQQVFHDKYGRFAQGHEVYSEKFGHFRGSTGVRLYIEQADATTLRVRALHMQLPNVTCVIDAVTGEPRCYDIEARWERPGWMRNSALNVAVDLWLFAITLARRQRRLSRATASKEFAPAA